MKESWKAINELLHQRSKSSNSECLEDLGTVKHQNCFRSNVKRTISPSGPQTHSKQKTANFSELEMWFAKIN